MSHIYVDHAATTPIHPLVVEAMLPFLENHYGNPSSIHGYGRKTRAALDKARREIAEHVGAEPGQIIFTSGGTEADNMALIGVALANQERGKHIITSKIEHHAVLHACEYLEKIGFEVTYLPVDSYGQVQLKTLQESLREDTILVSIMYGNNEVGTLQPIKELGDYLREQDVYFHTDAVQAMGIEAFNVKDLPVDMLSVSGHKLNGPKGIGFLYITRDVRIQPLLFGGAQERNRRAGTENIAGIVGLATACNVAYDQLTERRSTYMSYRSKLLDTLDQEGVEYQINGHPEEVLPHILNLSFKDTKADALLMNLDLEGIAASSGSACSAGSLQPSHVIQAMHEDENRVDSSIRFSFGLTNSLEQVEHIAHQTAKIIRRMMQQ